MARLLLWLGAMVAALVVGFIVIAIIAALPWWGIFSGFMAIGIVAVWILAIFDIWRRADLSVMAAVLWTAAVLIFPLLGTLVYFFTRPAAGQIQYRGETVA